MQLNAFDVLALDGEDLSALHLSIAPRQPEEPQAQRDMTKAHSVCSRCTIAAEPVPARDLHQEILSTLHLSSNVSRSFSPVSATKIARSLAGSVELPFSLTMWCAPGFSVQLSPAR